MNTPTLRSAIEQQNWDVAAHLLVYGLIKAQLDSLADPPVEDPTRREDLPNGKKRRTKRQSKRS